MCSKLCEKNMVYWGLRYHDEETGSVSLIGNGANDAVGRGLLGKRKQGRGVSYVFSFMLAIEIVTVRGRGRGMSLFHSSHFFTTAGSDVS